MAKKATKKAAASKSRDMLVVGSKTKDALKGDGKNKLNVSSDSLAALNDIIYVLIEKARARCVANGRKTIRPADF
jgi:histone H3/H4